MNSPVNVHLLCDEFDAALAAYTEELGFRIDRIFPADSPRLATLSLDGIRATLERSKATPEGTSPPTLLVTGPHQQHFSPGRAGMHYRDLIPGRYDGRFIASHIRIPAGGPVPDYVHHHDIEFQLIFCVNGWVKVAYEDQGEPMVMSAGDCFLQPPQIRHRVLECSDEMEVVEITCPAEHETNVDHSMTLPTGTTDRERSFGGQRFVFFQSAETPWQAAEDGTFTRNTGIDTATDGLVSAEVVRFARSNIDLRHNGELMFLFVLAGNATLGGAASHSLSRNYSVAIPGNTDVTLRDISEDFEILRVSAPSPSSGR